MKLCICGVPRSGKTTLSKHFEGPGERVMHSDDLVGRMGWSESSDEVARWLSAQGDWVIEGVTVVRALRKWMREHPGKPCDAVVWMPDARVPLSAGQATMAAGVRTVWDEVWPELRRRRVEIRVAGAK